MPRHFRRFCRKMQGTQQYLKFVATTDGRDKALKIAQYLARLYLFHTNVKPAPGPGGSQAAVVSRSLRNFASSLSVARKIMRLSNWLETGSKVITVLDGKKKMDIRSGRDLLWAVLETAVPLSAFITNVCDDFTCLGIIGALGPEYRKRFEPLAAQFWLVNVMFAVTVHSRALLAAHTALEEAQKTHAEDAQTQLRTRRFYLALGLVKLLADGVFVSFDVFRPSPARISPAIQIWAALVSALASSYPKWGV